MGSPKLALALGAICLIVLATPLQAWAYIDVGAGSVMLQAVVACVVGSLYAIKLHWGRLKGYLTGRHGADDPKADPETAPSDGRGPSEDA